KNTAQYLFPVNDVKGHLCSISWNKLFGACRCGFLTNNHKDSDRFVWRRAVSCLIFDNDNVIGQRANCEEENLIEVAAYAYDNSLKPFENEGTLLKEFSTKLQVETWYTFTLKFELSKTTYEIYNENNELLDSQEIIHRSCNNYNQGMKQTLYFGGQCPAPQEVSVCYEAVN
ncbi:unnamed protein product, partial [Didymodactylos carnosus]